MIKYTLFLLLILNLTDKAYGQKDSILVINCFKYSIVNGKNTGQRTIYNQKTFDKDGNLAREMFYNDTILQINSIAFYFYNNDKLIARDEYNSDNSIKEVKRYKYSAAGLLAEEVTYEPYKDAVTKKYSRTYTYQDTSVKQIVVYDKNNKWIEKTIIESDTNQRKEITKFKKGTDNNNLKESITVSQLSDNILIKNETRFNYFDGKVKLIHIDYTYSKDPDIETQKYQNADYQIFQITEIKYNKSGEILTKGNKNNDGSFIDFFAYERHIYLRIPIDKKMFPIQN